MESPPSLAESLLEQVATYSKTAYDLSKLRALETTATEGYLSKSFVENESESPLKKILGRALMFGITSVVAQNHETVSAFGSELMKIMEQKSEEYEMEYSNT